MGSVSELLTAVPLHQRPDLVEACAELINEEWKKSKTARMVSLQKSTDNFPLCLVLVKAPRSAAAAAGGKPVNTELLGHARLSRVVGQPESLFVETVVVARALRGQGYGRKLMEATERYARSRGFRHLHLTTHDKQHFYAHLGYVTSEPVQSMGFMSSLVPMEFLQMFSSPPPRAGAPLGGMGKPSSTTSPLHSRTSGANPPPLLSPMFPAHCAAAVSPLPSSTPPARCTAAGPPPLPPPLSSTPPAHRTAAGPPPLPPPLSSTPPAHRTATGPPPLLSSTPPAHRTATGPLPLPSATPPARCTAAGPPLPLPTCCLNSLPLGKPSPLPFPPAPPLASPFHLRAPAAGLPPPPPLPPSAGPLPSPPPGSPQSCLPLQRQPSSPGPIVSTSSGDDPSGQILLETPYRDLRGLPIFWMKKDI
ncbi:N-alpha-acetyltransferase 80 [Carettochelys insculpta]|uniref:N-alpha-acetyltransferase 80 n=1 Tax=Carettochelys insculpta TaxID=44489 RepID=UPI003EB787F3